VVSRTLGCLGTHNCFRALNAHDVDALVELFTEMDAGPTITADRFAWQKSEIRQWARLQVQADIQTEDHDYRVTEHGVAWDADMYRDDWRALGLTPLRVTNSIRVQNGQLADFTSKPSEPSELQRLGRLWQPGGSTGAPDHFLATRNGLSPTFWSLGEQMIVLRHSLAGSFSRAGIAIVTTGVGRALRLGVVFLGGAVLISATGVSAASTLGAQQAPPDAPLVVVESFLAARNAGGPFGATGWCAAVLELQDIDGQWFVDEPTLRYWLRQLTDKYVLDTVSPPVANGNTVTWTERLSPRSVSSSDPWSKVMTVEVGAVVRDGMIAYLSTPYPPLPLRPRAGAAIVEARYAHACANPGLDEQASREWSVQLRLALQTSGLVIGATH
jgi:hypothetical protein